MRLLLLWLMVCVLAAGTSAARTKRQSSSCRDHNGRTGTCRSLTQCPALNALASEGYSSADVQILRGAARGCRGRGRRGQTLLCCAQPSTRPSTRPPTRPPTSSGFTGNPEQHPNRGIVQRGNSCGLNFAERIIGGTEVPLGQFPWVAMLGYNKRSGDAITYECGGSLISLQYVLTAAHCVRAQDLNGFTLRSVRLGEHDKSQNRDCQRQSDGSQLCNSPQDFGISRVMFHDSYNTPRLQNDIALIKLDRPVREDNFVGKACLPFGDIGTRDYAGTDLTVAGFGKLGPGLSSSDVLLELSLPGAVQSSCASTLRRGRVTLSSNQFCMTSRRGQDSCAGDSGGPLVLLGRFGPPYTLVGIVSFGESRCGSGNVPSVNTRVGSYLNWILDRVDA